jgi:hypothetical protein
MVASAGTAVSPPATPVQNIASQWETGFVTATGAKPAAAMPASTLDARMGRTVETVSATGAAPETGMGFDAIGATSTPALGTTITAE